MKIHYLVYQVTNKVNGKIYIGCHITKDPDDKYMGSGKRLAYAKKKYGIENFEKVILSSHDTVEEMLAEETRLVNEEFLGRDDVYNLTCGGRGSWFWVNQLPKMKAIRSANINLSRDKFFENPSDEWIQLQSDKMKLRHKEEKIKYDTFTGKSHSEEAKRKIGEANSKHQSGEKNSQFGKRWMNKDGKNIQVLEAETYQFEVEGWQRGKVKK